MTVIGEAFVDILPVTTGFATAAKKGVQGALDEATKSSSGAFNSLATAGRSALLGIGAAGVATGAIALKLGGDFQQSMRLLVTGAGESQANIAMVQKGILGMASSVGAMPESLSKAMYMIESAGYHGAAGLNVLHAAAQGAKTDGADLQVVGNALTTVMNDMHAPASQAATVMSQMVTTVSLGKLRMDDLAGSIHSVLPNAAAMGLSFAQVGGAIATMTAQGISADQATQNLNHVIVALANPTAVMTKTMASYGLNAVDVAKNIGKQGLTGTFDQLYSAVMNQMGPAGLTLRSVFNQSQIAAQDASAMMAKLPPQAQDLAKQFMAGTISQKNFNTEMKALPAPMASLLTQWASTNKTAQGFAQYMRSGTAQAQTFAGAVAQMTGGQTGLQVALHLTGANMPTFQSNVAKIAASAADAKGNVKDWALVQQGFNFQISQAEAAVVAFATQLGLILIPYVEKLIGAAKDAVVWLTHHKDVLIALVAVIGGALTAAIAIYLAKQAMMAYQFAKNVIMVGVNIAAFLGLAAAEDAVGASGAVAAGGFDAMAVAATILDAIPIIALIAGIALAVVALGVGIYELVTHWQEVWTFIKQIAGDAWHWIDDNVVSPLKTGFDAAWGAIRGPVMAVVGFIEDHWRLLLPIILLPLAPIILIAENFGTLRNVAETVWNAISGAITTAWSIIGPVFNLIVGVIRDVLVFQFDVLRDIVLIAWTVISTAIEAAWSSILPVWNAISGFLGAILGVAFSVFRALVEVSWVLIQIAIKVAWDIIKPIFDAISAVLRDVVGPTISWLYSSVAKPTFDLIGTLVTAWWNDIVKPTFDLLVAFLRDIVAPTIHWLYDNVFSPVFGAIGQVVNFAWNNIIKPPLDAFISFVENDIPNAMNGLKSALDTIWKGIGDAVSTAWNNLIVAPIEGAINIVIRGINLLIDAVKAVAGVVGVSTSGLKDIALLGSSSGGGGGQTTGVAGVKMAAGGAMLDASTVGAGFMTHGIRAIVGEGNRAYPEAVIPTDPAHRANALALMVQTAQAMGIAHDSGIFGLGVGPNIGPNIAGTVTGAVGGALSAAGGVIGDIAGAIRSEAASVVLQPVFSAVNALIGAVPVPFLGGMVTWLEQQITNWVGGTVKQKANAQAATAATAGGGGPIPTGAHLALIQAALNLAGVADTPANEAAVNTIVNFESGWNPNAINLTDSNAKAGHPSQGLMQTIPSTFAGHAIPGYNTNIDDPLSNLIAGIRYAVGQYGSLTNVPGVRNVASGGHYVGYDSGGILPPGVTMAYNGTGRNERVISPSGAGGGGGVTLAAGAVQIIVQPGATVDASTIAMLRAMVEEAIAEAMEQLDGKMAAANPGGH